MMHKITGKKLSKDFYFQSCLIIAKSLIGKVLVHIHNKKLYAGIITETEAYLGSKDAASHSFKGKTLRNEVMFGEGGISYVYFTYGNHYCINVVTGEKNIAHAVLIRALEPVAGIDYMIKNRGTYDIHNLTSGPGKLTQAFGIDKRQNGLSYQSKELFIAEPLVKKKIKIVNSKRIGITKNPDKLWRFYEDQNPFVSRINRNAFLKNK